MAQGTKDDYGQQIPALKRTLSLPIASVTLIFPQERAALSKGV